MKRGKRYLAALMIVAMIFANVGPGVWAAVSGTEKEVLFEIEDTDLIEEIEEAAAGRLEMGDVEYETVDGEAGMFWRTFVEGGGVYELNPEIRGGGEGVSLRLFVKLPNLPDEGEYRVTGEEEILLLYVNETPDTVRCRVRVNRTEENGEEYSRITDGVVLFGYERFLEGADDPEEDALRASGSNSREDDGLEAEESREPGNGPGEENGQGAGKVTGEEDGRGSGSVTGEESDQGSGSVMGEESDRSSENVIGEGDSQGSEDVTGGKEGQGLRNNLGEENGQEAENGLKQDENLESETKDFVEISEPLAAGIEENGKGIQPVSAGFIMRSVMLETAKENGEDSLTEPSENAGVALNEEVDELKTLEERAKDISGELEQILEGTEQLPEDSGQPVGEPEGEDKGTDPATGSNAAEENGPESGNPDIQEPEKATGSNAQGPATGSNSSAGGYGEISGQVGVDESATARLCMMRLEQLIPSLEEQFTYEYEGNEIYVRLNLPKSTQVPADAVLRVEPVTEETDSDRLERRRNQFAEAYGGDGEALDLYDIGLYVKVSENEPIPDSGENMETFQEAGESASQEETDSQWEKLPVPDEAEIYIQFIGGPMEVENAVSVVRFGEESSRPKMLDILKIDEAYVNEIQSLTFTTEDLSEFGIYKRGVIRHTGGRGTGPYRALGLLLILGSGCLGFCQRASENMSRKRVQ